MYNINTVGYRTVSINLVLQRCDLLRTTHRHSVRHISDSSCSNLARFRHSANLKPTYCLPLNVRRGAVTDYFETPSRSSGGMTYVVMEMCSGFVMADLIDAVALYEAMPSRSSPNFPRSRLLASLRIMTCREYTNGVGVAL